MLTKTFESLLKQNYFKLPKAIEALNTVKKYFMNSTDDCNEINSIFKLIASVQSKESTKQSKITSFFCLSNKFFLLFVFYSVCVNFFVLS